MFYVPHNQINFFYSKEKSAFKGEYQFTLAHRIYLKVVHFNSGRINKKNDIKEIVSYFNSHKKSVLNAIKHLEEKGLVKSSKNYFTFVGRDTFLELYPSKSKTTFKFSEEDLTDLKRFKAKLFACLGQTIAQTYGKKTITNEIGYIVKYMSPIEKSNIGKFIKKEKPTYVSSNHLIPGLRLDWTQEQSCTYLGILMNRTKQVMSVKIKQADEFNFLKVQSKKIKKENSNEFIYERRFSYLKSKSFECGEAISYSSYNEALNELNRLKSEMGSYFDKSIVKFVPKLGFSIVKFLPNEISYKLESKLETFTNF